MFLRMVILKEDDGNWSPVHTKTVECESYDVQVLGKGQVKVSYVRKNGSIKQLIDKYQISSLEIDIIVMNDNGKTIEII